MSRRLTRAAARGAAATVVMSVPMLARWALQPEPPPPMVVGENLQRRLGLEPKRYPAAFRHAIWGAAHLAFGAALGIAASAWPRRTGAEPAAHSFGLAVWTANYGIALPAARLYPWVWADDCVRAAETLVSHLVYAAALRRLAPAA